MICIIHTVIISCWNQLSSSHSINKENVFSLIDEIGELHWFNLISWKYCLNLWNSLNSIKFIRLNEFISWCQSIKHLKALQSFFAWAHLLLKYFYCLIPLITVIIVLSSSIHCNKLIQIKQIQVLVGLVR